jgi:hypothetical protein
MGLGLDRRKRELEDGSPALAVRPGSAETLAAARPGSIEPRVAS